MSSMRIDPMPLPEDEAEVARIEYTARVARMLDGTWKDAAREKLVAFYHPSVRRMIGDASIARNPILALVNQLSGIVDQPPSVRVEGLPEDVDLRPLTRNRLWAMLQDQQDHLVGLHEVVCVLNYSAAAGLTFEFMDPCAYMECEQSKANLDQFKRATVCRLLRPPGGGQPEWVRETWQIDPVEFRAEAHREVDGRKSWVDVTAEYWESLEVGYPYRDRAGAPIMPHVIVHDRLRTKLWSPYKGAEIAAGTLETSALNSWWLAGCRDGSSPLRLLVDAIVQGTETTAEGDSYVPFAPGAALMVTSKGEKTASMHQFAPAVDVKSFGEAIEDYMRGLVVYAGVSPSDLQITGGQSGYAIALSREGQRKMQRRLEPSVANAISLILATAARLVNAYEGGDWPEDPQRYIVTFAGVPETPEEIKGKIEAADAMLESGALSPVDHLRMIRSDMATADDAQCMAYLIAAREQRAQLAAIGAPQTPPPSPVDPDPEEAHDEAPKGENDDG